MLRRDVDQQGTMGTSTATKGSRQSEGAYKDADIEMGPDAESMARHP